LFLLKQLLRLLLIFAYYLYDEERDLQGSNYLGLFIFIFSFHTFLFLFIERDMWPTVLAEGKGGGYMGLFLAGWFIDFMGFFASLIVTFCLIIASILLIFNFAVHLFQYFKI
jgi:hypothetical protein